MVPTAAAVMASSPISAPVGTTIWPPFSFGERDQVLVLQQRADAEHDRGLAARHHGRDDGADQPARRAFDDDVGGIRQRLDRQRRGPFAELVEPAAMLLDIGGGDRRKLEPVDAVVERLGKTRPDRTEAGDGDA